MTSDRHWPRGLLAFFVVFVGAIVGFSTWSILRNPVDLVEKDYYAEEIRYQEQIDRKQRTAALAERPSITLEPAGRGILLQFPGPVEEGTAVFYRPSDSSLDETHPLQLDGAHRQRLDAARLVPGRWKIRLTWKMDGLEYFLEETVVID